MLQSLRGDSLVLWTNLTARREALQAIVEAQPHAPFPLSERIERVDRAVVDALLTLRFPRGPVRQVTVEARATAAGRKQADCTLVISLDRINDLLQTARGPDTIFRTWVHESIHARQPFAPDFRLEYSRWRGYEEGLAEGIARFVVRDEAGLDPIEGSFDYYVAAYRALAEAAGLDLRRLWRRLWAESALGEVRGHFATVVTTMAQAQHGVALSDLGAARLRGIADQVFQSNRSRNPPSPDVMMRLWGSAFR